MALQQGSSKRHRILVLNLTRWPTSYPLVSPVEVESGQFWVLLAACGVFVLAGAMRLARFNLASSKPRTGWFAGVPITAAGGGLLSSMVIVRRR